MVNQRIRRLCWEKYIGKKFSAKCFISWCPEEITVWKFDTGHILASVNGGGDNVENLRPICRFCNNHSKDINMKDFDEMYADPQKRSELSGRYSRRKTRNPPQNENYNELDEFEDDEYSSPEEMLNDIKDLEKDLNSLKNMYNQIYGEDKDDVCCCKIS
jgi:hypothetical protein